MEIKFLIDDELERVQRELDAVFNTIEHEDPELKKNTRTLRVFTKAILKSMLPEKIIREEYREIKKPLIIEQVVKKPISLEIFPVPVPSTEEIEQPVQRFQTITKYKPEVVRKFIGETSRVIERPKVITEDGSRELGTAYPLIVEKESNLPLALAEVNEGYKVLEPNLNENEKEAVKRLKDKLKNKISKIINNNELDKYIGKTCKKYGVEFTEDALRKIRYFVIRDLINLGPVEPLLNDKNILKIECNGPNENVFVDYKGVRKKTNVVFKKVEDLNKYIEYLGERVKQKVDEANPILDSRINGFKVQAALGLGYQTAKFSFVRE